MEIEELLGNRITEGLEDLAALEVGTEEYKNAVDGLTRLVDRAIEMDKVNIASSEKEEDREIDRQFKEQAAIDEKKDRLVKNILTGAGIVIPTAVTIWGTLKSFKFEESGTVTTMLGRGFIQKLLPKK